MPSGPSAKPVAAPSISVAVRLADTSRPSALPAVRRQPRAFECPSGGSPSRSLRRNPRSHHVSGGGMACPSRGAVHELSEQGPYVCRTFTEVGADFGVAIAVRPNGLPQQSLWLALLAQILLNRNTLS
jgi:hypothetical protein